MRGSFCILFFCENFPASCYVLCGSSGRLQLEMFGQSLIRPCSAASVCRVFLVVAVVENCALDGDQRITWGYSSGSEPVLFLLEDLKTGCWIRGTWCWRPGRGAFRISRKQGGPDLPLHRLAPSSHLKHPGSAEQRGLGRSRFGPTPSCPYAPKCREDKFCELPNSPGSSTDCSRSLARPN